MERKRKLLIAGLTLFAVVVASAALAVYRYQADQQAQLAQQQAIDKGIALYRQAKYPEALEALQSAPEDAGPDWHLPYYTGATLVRMKNYEPAAVQLEKAKELNHSEPQILYLLGVVYFKLGKLELSEGYFAATLELDPTHEHAKGLLGVMVNLQQRQPQAGDMEDAEKEIPEDEF